MPITHAGPRTPHIWKARVVDVDVNTWTVTVIGMHTKKTIPNVPFGSPYQHPQGGEGVFIMPEVGSFCWVCEPSDGNTAFVIAWGPLANDGDFTNNKPDLNPGDIYLGTRDGNSMVLRRGGVVQIKTAGLAQRLFLPINNWIKDFCENFGLYTLGGDLEWTVDRPETTTDGKRPSRLRVSAREFAHDPKPVAVLEIGSHEEDEKAILSLNIFSSGEDAQELKVSVLLDKEGNMSFVAKKSVTWTITENHTMDVGGDILVKQPGSKTTKWGSESADENWVLGQVLKEALTILTTTGTIMSPVGPCVVDPTWKPKYLDNPDTNILAKNKFTQRE